MPLEWLQGYDEVCLFFDNDETGYKATQEAANVLPPGKVTIANLNHDYKDASDALMANDAEAILQSNLGCQTYRPDGIVSGKDLLELVTTPNPPHDHEYPFNGLNDKASRHQIRRACVHYCRIGYRKVLLL